MIRIVDKAQCCGCGACTQTCPLSCIVMTEDNEGFLYPSVDTTKCCDCGRCEAVCPTINADSDVPRIKVEQEAPYAVGGWIKDETIRAASSSGGAFTLFANEILKRNGVVFGAALENRSVIHISACCEEELSALRGSKYVQSVIGDTFRQVKTLLEEGKSVLYTGTPCQTAGLASFLGKKYENLYLIDFICHGVPSPKVFSQYLDSIERKTDLKITSFSFREKDKGWLSSGLQMGTRVKLSDNSEIRRCPALRDSYMNGFLEDIYLRPSCYQCKFKTLPKWESDITIANFWGVDRVLPNMNDGKGTSLILIHNEHGKKLFDEVKDAFHYQECDWQRSVVKNQMLLHSATVPILRERFFDELNVHGYDWVAKKHMTTFKAVCKKLSKIIGQKTEKGITSLITLAARILHIRLTDAMQKKMLQFIKFCMVGVTNTAVSYSVNVSTLFLLSRFWPGIKFDYIIANTTAFLVAVYWSFFWNSRKVFHFKTNDRALKRKALLRSYMCYGFTGILINNILSTIWINVLGISKLISPLLNLVITIPLNYFTNKKWAFGIKPKDEV